MASEIKVPEMGESVIEATVINWLKKAGDKVSAGEPVVELETDKVTLEVSASQAGVLQKILRQVGETVGVGDTLAVIDEDGEPSQKTAPPDAAQPNQAAQAAPPPTQPAPETAPAAHAPEKDSVRISPVAQRMAQELGLDPAKITPSGSGGRISKEDVQAFAAKSATTVGQPKVVDSRTKVADSQADIQATDTKPPQQPSHPASLPDASIPGDAKFSLPPITASPQREERVRMSRRRQTIARRLVEAQHTAAMLTTFNEIDLSAVMDLRKRRRDGFKERYGVDLGFMSFFVKASISALKAFPFVNAEIQGEEFVLKHFYDIGVAIGAEEGLVVPVVRDADRLNFAGIEKAIREFVDKVKQGQLSLEDLRGGTFTITNGGVFGSLMSTPILNPPQVAILGMHAIKDRPIALDGQVVIRPMMYVALSYDHRIVDGRIAVQFLVRIKELIEDPESLLFG